MVKVHILLNCTTSYYSILIYILYYYTYTHASVCVCGEREMERKRQHAHSICWRLETFCFCSAGFSNSSRSGRGRGRRRYPLAAAWGRGPPTTGWRGGDRGVSSRTGGAERDAMGFSILRNNTAYGWNPSEVKSNDEGFTWINGTNSGFNKELFFFKK